MKKIEHFYTGLDIQIQIDHKNPEWYDEENNLLIEDIDEYLQDNDIVEVEFEKYRDSEGTLYIFESEDIISLKDTGICRLYKL